MSIVPGWHTAIFGPYFVVGAIYSGVAGVITLMVILRWVFGLDEIIRRSHLNNLSKLLLVIALMWSYFYFSEFITAWYAKKPVEWRVWLYQAQQYPYQLLVMLVGSAFAITMLSFHKVRTNAFLLLIVTLVINVGMFIERYLIVVPALSHKDNPFIWTHYLPSPVEVAVVIGSFAYFVLLYAVFVKLLPVVTVADIREGNLISGDLRVGNAVVRVQAQLED